MDEERERGRGHPSQPPSAIRRAIAELLVLLPFLATGAANALLVGDGTLYLLHALGLGIVVSSGVVVVETSITDYFWKAGLVFRTRPTARSFLAYQAASAVSLAVQLVATPALTFLGMYYLVAYPVAVVLGWVVKYAIVRRAVFR